MKDYDLRLTKESIEDSIKQDSLNRNKKLNKLIELLNSVDGNKIISIDGKWGCGKTVFLKQLEYINKNKIENLNNLKINPENIKKFHDTYSVYYYNAWENDFHISPLLSLIYNLINDFPKEQSQTASNKIELPFNFKEALKTLSHNTIDIDKVETFKDITSEIHTLEEKQIALNNIIDNIIPDDKKLIFIIDELDRCKPDYAINMLEVIKHVYSNDKIVFLIGTNNEQLSYTISNYYGINFDGYGYLTKFYNLIIELNDVSPSEYLKSVIGIAEPSEWVDCSLHAVCNFFGFQMRGINRILNDFDILSKYFDTFEGFQYNEDAILKYVFLPYSLGLKQKETKLLTNFLKGDGYHDLKNFVISDNNMKKIVEYSLKNSKKISEDIKESEILEHLKCKYVCYFSSTISDWEIKQKKTEFMNIFSLLGDSAKF